MTIILDTFIKAIWVSSMALCFVAWFVSYILIIAYCPPKSQYYDTLLRTLLSTIKIMCAIAMPGLVWLYIADSILKLRDSILFDPALFWQVCSNVDYRIDHGWQWLEYVLIVIFGVIWWILSISTIPNMIKKARFKIPYPTTIKEKINAEILDIIEQIYPFILIAISPIVIIPIFLLIFGWPIE